MMKVTLGEEVLGFERKLKCFKEKINKEDLYGMQKGVPLPQMLSQGFYL